MKYNLIDLKNLNNIRSHVVKNKVTAWPHWVGGENTEIGGEGGKVRKEGVEEVRGEVGGGFNFI